ncbi:MAG: hypothetical protein EZS28_022471 [Streblomastix strix]|uniref:HNH nuclease domain-containing protein n=1 Tax=Streblomastix strix TaxID=222440 RepID=A0A5J4VHS9_9EUKA|nr:MAG: hypothetical protein EZS28_022471 [Streblomastix strix]
MFRQLQTMTLRQIADVDHINRIRDDNHIENLRWITHRDNTRNQSSNHNIQYTYVDQLSEDAITVNDYGSYQFEFYYYDLADDEFYYFNGRQYRQLHVNTMKSTGALYVQMMDTTDRKRSISINKFKRLYEIDY